MLYLEIRCPRVPCQINQHSQSLRASAREKSNPCACNCISYYSYRFANPHPSSPFHMKHIAKIALLLALAFLPAISRAQFACTTNANNTITITGYVGIPPSNIVIPARISGHLVVNIADDSFFENTNSHSVIIPDSVTNIGSCAFAYCENLTSVLIGAYVANIGDSAFYDCNNLTSITIPRSVINIGAMAFQRCGNLTNAAIYSGALGWNAFHYCYNLTSVTIGDGVIHVTDGAFSDANLSSLTIGSNVTTIGSYAFHGSGLTNASVPASVISIGDTPFQGCNNLEAITVDPANPNYCSINGVLYAKNMATLYECPSGLNGSIIIPNTVNNIANGAFYGNKFTGITVDPASALFSSTNGVLFSKDFNNLILCPGGMSGNYCLPDIVTNILDFAFQGCQNLTNIVLGTHITCIGNNVFSGCSGLLNILIPDNVKAIGTSAFYGCSGLSNLIIPNSVTVIGRDAFYSCTGLTNIVFGSGVSDIGAYAFTFCDSLSNIVIPNTITSIGPGAFACSGLMMVRIPHSVTNIGDNAFYYCQRLASVVIGTNVSSIGYCVFETCTNLSSVSFQGNAPIFMANVFLGDPLLTIYHLPHTTGWDTFTGPTPVLWDPHAIPDATFGVRTNRFGFTITNAGTPTIIVDACTNLANAVWTPISTNTLVGGSSYFSDPQWTNHPGRFYRFRAP